MIRVPQNKTKQTKEKLLQGSKSPILALKNPPWALAGRELPQRGRIGAASIPELSLWDLESQMKSDSSGSQILMCKYVHMFMGEQTRVHTCVCMCGDQKTTLNVALRNCAPCFLRKDLSVTWSSSNNRSAGYQAQGPRSAPFT